MIKANFRKGELHPKGWGSETWIVNNDKYCGKLLTFNKGSKFSLHYHLIKEETFYVLKGELGFNYRNLSNGQECYAILREGSIVDIPVGFPHQLIAIEDSIIIEFSTHHEDSDSYRVEPGDSQKNG